MESAGTEWNDLRDAGWAVIFPAERMTKGGGGGSDAVRRALQPLLELRRGQAGSLYREFSGGDGLRPNEPALPFLSRQGAAADFVDPARLPYYVLLAGDFDAIPYSFQRTLSLSRAVGRLYFDRPEEYAAYVRSVVAAETGSARPRRRAAFMFAPPSYEGGAREALAKTLSDTLAQNGWTVDGALGQDARKMRLSDAINDPEGGAVMVATGHSACFPSDFSRRPALHGALICSDWPGPAGWKGPLRPEFLFAGQDVNGRTDLTGRIAFLHAAFSAGTAGDEGRPPVRSSVRPAGPGMVSRLAQTLLCNPGGGMLAVVGWLEEVWQGASLMNTAATPNLLSYALASLREGSPLGAALRPFREEYSETAARLAEMLEGAGYSPPNDEALVALWARQVEARSCTIIGDPAVRLTFAEKAVEAAPPATEVEASTQTSGAQAQAPQGGPRAGGPNTVGPATSASGEGTETSSTPDEEERVLWEGRPFLSLNTTYRLTNRRVQARSGAEGQEQAEMELAGVQNIAMSQSMTQRLAGTGDITLRSAVPKIPDFVLKNVRDPQKVQTLIFQAIDRTREVPQSSSGSTARSPDLQQRS